MPTSQALPDESNKICARPRLATPIIVNGKSRHARTLHASKPKQHVRARAHNTGTLNTHMTPGGASSGQAHTRNSMRLQQHWQQPPPSTRISSHISAPATSSQPQTHSSCSTCRRWQTSFARYPTHRSERTCMRTRIIGRVTHAHLLLSLSTAMACACVSIKQLHCPRCPCGEYVCASVCV